MKEFIIWLLVLIGAGWLVNYLHLPINDYVLYGICFVILILVGMYQESTKRWRAISLKDAFADELMHLRYDLTEIKVKQYNRGWDSIPDDFLKMVWMYGQYRYIGICDSYSTKYDDWGKIIIDLSDEDWFDEDYDSVFDRVFNCDSLRKIKSPRKNRLKKGMNVKVHIYEKELVEHYGECYGKYAEILSIQKGDWPGNLILTLEIYLRSALDYDHHCPPLDNEEELIEQSKIIRKVKINNYFRHGIRIDPQDNTGYENLVARISQVWVWREKNQFKFATLLTIFVVILTLDPMIFALLLALGLLVVPIIAICRN